MPTTASAKATSDTMAMEYLSATEKSLVGGAKKKENKTLI